MSDLTPDLAKKVLAANLRNIVKKIGDGGLLTTAEHAQMEEAKGDGLLAEEIQRARRAALIRKYSRGHKLSTDEQAEMGVIPATHVTVKRVTSETYKLTLREYVEILIKAGMPDKKDNARKLKSWIKHGRFDKHQQLREEPDLPPFDQLDQLASWWRRNMTYKPPDFMVALEKSVVLDKVEEPSSDKLKAEQSAPPTATEEKAGGNDFITIYGEIQLEGELANDFTVKILAGAAMDSYRRYEEARTARDWRAARIIREELLDDVKALQKAKIEATKMLASLGEYLRERETMSALNNLLAMQDTSFYNALDEAIREANPRLADDERRDLSMKYRDKVFEHFHGTNFERAWTPQDHAA